MLEQLKELLEMQRELDTAILKQHGNIYDENIAEQTKISLFVELGEMMNELPTRFKHWKFTAKDNREKALIEYVDALHFQMSLFNHYKLNIDNIPDYDKCIKYDIDLSLYLRCCCTYCDDCDGIVDLFCIGNYLGFSWNEIYNAYKAKNEINYLSLKNGY